MHEIDRLAREAFEAKQAGLSYGHYKARQLRADTERRMSARLKHERLPVCACCGNPIPKGSRARKYCSPECANRAHERQNNAAKKRRREAAQREMEGEHEM